MPSIEMNVPTVSAAKKYFNTLCDSFNAEVKAILDEIKELA